MYFKEKQDPDCQTGSNRVEHMHVCDLNLLSNPRESPGPKVIKLFSCSTEHEICPANKSQITNNCKFFLAIKT